MYRYNFRQTYSEFCAPTGYWKPILAMTMFVVGVCTWQQWALMYFRAFAYFLYILLLINYSILSHINVFQWNPRCRRRIRRSGRSTCYSAWLTCTWNLWLGWPPSGIMSTIRGKSSSCQTLLHKRFSICLTAFLYNLLYGYLFVRYALTNYLTQVICLANRSE